MNLVERKLSLVFGSRILALDSQQLVSFLPGNFLFGKDGRETVKDSKGVRSDRKGV